MNFRRVCWKLYNTISFVKTTLWLFRFVITNPVSNLESLTNVKRWEMKVRIFMSCKWQGRIQKIPKGVGETLKQSQKKEWPQCPRPRPKSAHERCLKNCENKRQWTQHCNANNSFTTVFGCILNSSSENDSSEADSLLSDESFSSGRNSRQGDSENNTQRTSRRKKRKVCCFFKKINLPLSSPMSDVSIATSSLGFLGFYW